MTHHEELRLCADMVEKESWEELAYAMRHAPPELKAYIKAVEPDKITALLDENAVLLDENAVLRAALQRVGDHHLFDTLKSLQVLAAEALDEANRRCR